MLMAVLVDSEGSLNVDGLVYPDGIPDYSDELSYQA